MPQDTLISPEERYKRVCSMLTYFCDRMDQAFKLFVQISTAVIGGFIWLRMQPNSSSVDHLFAVGRWIIPILAAVTIGQIIFDHISWYGYRRAEANLLGREDLKPSFPNSGKLEYLRITIITIVGLGAFCWLR